MIDRAELIGMLKNTDSYISGQEICAHFDVSRNAVWKMIGRLKEEGYVIEAVPNRGYRLIGTPDILSAAEISSRLNTEWMAGSLYYYDKTDSTNIRIRRLADEGVPEGTLAVADVQTAGRGRRGRSWASPAGVNISMSLLLRPRISPQDAPMLTLVMALAAAKGISEETGCRAQIKWPNDIVIDGRKVCGILTEMDMEADYIRNVIVGIGINTNQASKEEFAEEYREHAGSLRMAAGRVISRASVIAKIITWFEKYYDIFMKTYDLSGLSAEYNSELVNKGRDVKVLDPAGEYEGKAHGINDRGELIVEKADGSCTEVYAGEVSVRGLYGYV